MSDRGREENLAGTAGLACHCFRTRSGGNREVIVHVATDATDSGKTLSIECSR